MRRNNIVIKSNAYGLIIRLDPDISFEQLENDVADKFREAARFFRNAQMAITFQGRDITEDEEYRLIDVITQNTQLHIVCLVDESKEHAASFKEAVVRTLENEQQGRAQIHRGTLKAGSTLESESSLVVLGDVNPGASITTAGDLIIMGCCMGSVTAGFGGRRESYIAALTMLPAMIRIADKAARSAITKKEDTGDYPIDPKIALIRDEHLVLERLNGSVFDRINESLQN